MTYLQSNAKWWYLFTIHIYCWMLMLNWTELVGYCYSFYSATLTPKCETASYWACYKYATDWTWIYLTDLCNKVIDDRQWCLTIPWISSIADTFIIHKHTLQSVTYKTRKLCYRKDDHAMCPIHGRPENFWDSLTCPQLLFPTFFTGFCSYRPYECSYKIWSA